MCSPIPVAPIWQQRGDLSGPHSILRPMLRLRTTVEACPIRSEGHGGDISRIADYGLLRNPSLPPGSSKSQGRRYQRWPFSSDGMAVGGQPEGMKPVVTALHAIAAIERETREAQAEAVCRCGAQEAWSQARIGERQGRARLSDRH